MSMNHGENGLEIAVIGMAGRFPGARNVEEFWENLKNGVESITFYSGEELQEAGIGPDLLESPNYVRSGGGILEDKEYFDASFFGYSPLEAELMDPQVRVFHECAWHALENSGYNPFSFDGLIGLYAGASFNITWEALSLFSGRVDILGSYATWLLIDRDYLCTRVSYNLNLRGPSVIVKTACSTSLVAVHMACQALLNGECDIALAGGVTITRLTRSGYLYQEDMITSLDGHCRAFDARAKGTVFGDGVGIVVLKQLEEAVADGDYIYAVIKGSAINNDGIRKAGYTAPSVVGQSDVISEAIQVAEVEPETITYIETHGTGTAVGDPIEIEALRLAFNTNRKGFCAIGSVKTNVGHLDMVAGVAGFIKTVLALKHRLLPPSLHFETPNPETFFDNSPFFVNTELREWKRDGYPRRAGVSSFGIGGTNAHVVLEEAAEISRHNLASPSNQQRLILVSARTQNVLDRATENLAKYLRNNPGINLADAAYTLQVGRRTYPFKRMVVCSDVNEALEVLTGSETRKAESFYSEEKDPCIIFMFPGQGSQYVNMGLRLLKTENVFREEMERCFEILKPLMGNDMKEVLYPGLSQLPTQPPGYIYQGGGVEAAATQKHQEKAGFLDINQTQVSQPMIFSIQYSLARLLIQWGIKPHAMIGHSIGEYGAALLSGVFSLEEALKLVVLRGQLMQQLPSGAMLSVPLSEAELKPLIEDDGNISIAAVNSSSRCVVSGPHQAVGDFEQRLHEKGYETRRLYTSHAFHSKMMEPILEEFTYQVKQVRLNKPKIPYISNVTGQWATEEDARDPAYWAAHLRKTVRFADGITELLGMEKAVFVEIGPGNVLSTFVKQHRHCSKEQSQRIVNLIRHHHEDVPDDRYLLNQIGRLWLCGQDVDWAGFYSREKRYRIPLPTYPFDRQRFAIDGDSFVMGFERMTFDSLTSKSRRRPDMADWFYIPAWERSVLKTTANPEDKRPSCWLVFLDDCGLGSRLVRHLKQDEEDVITAGIGPEFLRLSAGKYNINPTEKYDYHSLFRELKKLKKVPGRIVHLWGVTGNKDKCRSGGLEGINIDRSQDIGLFSLLNIAQALESEGITDKIQIGVVTDNMQEVIGEELLCPEKATVLGAVKVIPLEYPNLKCSSMDIIVPDPESLWQDRLINFLLEEFESDFSQNVVAFRSKHRWVQTMKPHRLEKHAQVSPRLKRGGVYLITGGLGGMGFTLVEHLAKRLNAKLILVGRSFFPSREAWDDWLTSHGQEDKVSLQIKKIQEWEKSGAEILIASADIANLGHVKDVIVRAQKRLGQINGVLHAAGVADYEGVIQRRTRQMTEKVMAPKVMGTLVLDTILKDVNLDFFVLFSSIGNVLYKMGFGQVGYHAANEFLEAYACYKTSRDDVFTVAVNWNSWQEVGMAVEAVNRRTAQKGQSTNQDGRLYGALKPIEGIEVFNRILDHNLVRVTVSPQDLENLLRRMHKELDRGTGSGKEVQWGILPESMHQRPEMNTLYIAPRNETEETIVHIWQKFLGIEPVGIQDNFFQLGGDSLLAVQLVSWINETFKTKLSSHVLLNKTTIQSLAQLITADRAPVSSLLVEMQPQLDTSRGKPLVLVHPIGGHVYFYRELVAALGAEQPIYGLKAPGLDQETEPLTSIEEMAALYIKEVQRVQPVGPYQLGGASFGGIVAFEMAQQLWAQQQEVALLFMIDAPGPGHMPPEFEDDAAVLAYILISHYKDTSISLEQIRQMESQQLREFILARGGIEAEENPDAFIEQVYHHLHIFKAHFRAMSNYFPNIYPGSMHYFRATQPMPFSAQDPEQAWIDLAAAGIVIHDIPGDHITMNYHPNVEVIANLLIKALHDSKPSFHMGKKIKRRGKENDRIKLY